jgi:hypothetical protein
MLSLCLRQRVYRFKLSFGALELGPSKGRMAEGIDICDIPESYER